MNRLHSANLCGVESGEADKVDWSSVEIEESKSSQCLTGEGETRRDETGVSAVVESRQKGFHSLERRMRVTEKNR